MSKTRITRRNFLKTSGLGLVGTSLLRTPALILLEAISGGLMDRAIAAEAGIKPKKWVDMRFDGAPPRWHYDLILQSEADKGNFIANTQVATRFEAKAGRYVNPLYSTTLINGIRAPYLWQFNVPTVNNGTRPMKDLLNYFLNIRGIYTANSGHGGNWDLHYTPLGASVSLPALGADFSSAPISAVYLNAVNYLFRSKTGKGALQLASGANLLNTLLNPFKPSSSVATVRANEKLLQNYVNTAREALASEAFNRHPDSKLAKESMKNARDLMQKNFGDLNSIWPELKMKYESLILRALHSTLPGLNDLPVGSISGERGTTYWYGLDNPSMEPDLRNMIQDKTSISLMAESFAVTEFILRNNLSDSITVSMGSLTNLKVGTRTNGGLGHDQHYVGVMPGTLLNSLYSLAHAACLLELISQLPGPVWKNTVINCSGEMIRTPWFNGRGADHSSTANLALYSGCIQGPMVLGNILATPPGSVNYPGTWGAAGPMGEDLIQGRIEPGHAHNTVATLLGVPGPIAARPSLIQPLTETGGIAVPTVARGKILP